MLYFSGDHHPVAAQVLVSLVSLAALATGAAAASDDSISRPTLDESLFVLGQFNAFSNYDSLAKYNLSNPQADSLYELSSDSSDVTPLGASVFSSTPSQMVSWGSSSGSGSGNNKAVSNSTSASTMLAIVSGTPALYDLSSQKVEALPGWSNVTGEVQTVLVDSDNEIAYFGGDISYGSSSGAVAYDISSQEVVELPFKGFGSGSVVSAITMYDDSVVFGGKFTQLGNETLQTVQNSTTNTTSTGSWVEPDQPINLGLASISTANSDEDSDPSAIICPHSGSNWKLSTDQNGGTWTAKFPFSVYPSKVRLYNGDSNAVKYFRITSAPSNSILNLTYVDPDTREIRYCDSSCPLAALSSLKSGVSAAANTSSSGVYQVADVADISGTLGFSEEYQEFEFVNELSMNAFTIQILDHYGDTSELQGIELFQFGLDIYANDTLNEPGCSSQSVLAASKSIGGLTWKAGSSNDYLTASVSASDIEAGKYGYRYDSNLPSSGNFTFLLYTPGCGSDETCDNRGIVNATLFAPNGSAIASKAIYQTNNDLKYDTIFSGYIDVSDSVDAPYMEVTLLSAGESDTVVFVAGQVVVQYDSIELTDSTSGDIPLNGLFEYSLSNFTDGEDYPVGNSSINRIGASLSDGATVSGLYFTNSSKLYLAGDFNSSYGNNFFGVDVTDYSDNNEITGQEVSVGGVDGAVDSLSTLNESLVLLGDFSSAGNSSVHVESIALFDGKTFTSLNVSDSSDVTGLSSLQYNGSDYLVVNYGGDSSSVNGSSKAVSTSGGSSVVSSGGSALKKTPTLGLDLTQGGSSGYAFGEVSKFDKSASHAAYFNSSYQNGVSQDIGALDAGLYINSTTVALGGKNVVLLSDGSAKNLSDELSLDSVTDLYTYDDTLYVGLTQGTYKSKDIYGLLAYDLNNGSIVTPSVKSGAVSAMDIDPASEDLLVGGNFSTSDCSKFCLYNASTNSFSSASSDDSVSGINWLKYYRSDVALLGGDLQINSKSASFAVYNATASSVSSLDVGGLPGTVNKFIFAALNNSTETTVKTPIAVLGDDFVGYLDNLKYASLMDGIESSDLLFTDIALVNGTDSNNFYGKELLVLSGRFNLTSYGQVTTAMHDGSQWYPVLVTATDRDTSNAAVNSIVRTSKNYVAKFNGTSPDEPTSSPTPTPESIKSVKYFTKGQVVGIGCALALATTFLLTGLGAAIYKLGKKDTQVGPLKSRVGEEKMMEVLPPGEVVANMEQAKQLS